MVRFAVRRSVFVGLFAVPISRAAAQVEDVLPLPPMPPPHTLPSDKLVQQLNQRINFDGLNDPKLTLADEVVVLEKTYRITLTVDEAALQRESKQTSGQLLARRPVPAMKGVPLDEVLEVVFSRFAGATFYVDGDRVRITTHRQALEDGWIAVNQLVYSATFVLRQRFGLDLKRHGIEVIRLYARDSARVLHAIANWSHVVSDSAMAILSW
jgi:hypothetical protein